MFSSIKFRSLNTDVDTQFGEILSFYKILDHLVKMENFRHKMTPDILERKENSAGIRHIRDMCTILNYDWTLWLILSMHHT